LIGHAVEASELFFVLVAITATFEAGVVPGAMARKIPGLTAFASGHQRKNGKTKAREEMKSHGGNPPNDFKVRPSRTGGNARFAHIMPPKRV
jgi:hypothetical protein